LARVPTWNYLAVHCTVEARLIDPAHEKDALLKALIGDHEPRYADQWRSLPEDYQQRMLGGITAFDLNIVECQCKLKLNQHRPESRDAMLATYRSGMPDARLLADWIERVSPVRD
jgi:transcriptional regulator